MRLEYCYKHYHTLVDKLPITNQISVNLPATTINLIMKSSSNCVVAYGNTLGKCDECLLSTFEQQQTLTSITHLVRLTGNQKKILGRCISTKEIRTCRTFKVVSNEICDHEISKQSLSKHLSNSIEAVPGSTAGRVTYRNQESLECLVRQFEVLVVSSYKSYVWMVFNRRVTMCPDAQWTGDTFDMRDYPLRRKSSRKVYAQYYDYREKERFDSIIW